MRTERTRQLEDYNPDADSIMGMVIALRNDTRKMANESCADLIDRTEREASHE
jgi:hypothetical protein